MWNYRYLARIDFRVIPILFALALISILIISSNTIELAPDGIEETFFTQSVKRQIQGFIIGCFIFIFFVGFDYNKLREWTWILYGIMLFLLIGLFFTDAIQRVHRWYRVPIINYSFQPSEYAKLIVVITLSWYLEKTKSQARSWGTAFFGLLIAGIPFLLILKQPDLGTALVLFPITLVMFYFGDIHPTVIRMMTTLGGLALVVVALLFLGIVSHEEIRPYATKFLKDYQFDRLNPNTHHQKASTTAIAVGGLTGTGWKKSCISIILT